MVYRTIARGPVETASTATSFYLQKREKRRCVSEASATPGDAPQPRERPRRERRVEPLEYRHGHEVQFLGPDRRRTGDREHSTALRGGLRLRRDRRSDDLGPDALHVAQKRLWGQVVGEHRQGRLHGPRGASVVGHPVPAIASAPAIASELTSPSETSSRVTPGSSPPVTCSRSVAVIIAGPSPARSRSTSARRRRASSSLITSSSRTSGGLWRCSARASRSASNNPSTAR